MHIHQGSRRLKVQIYAIGNHAESAIQAEAQALVIATNILARLQIKDAIFLTDNLSLAKAAAARSPRTDPGHWEARGLLAEFCAVTNASSVQFFHISRLHNMEAHDLAQLALTHITDQQVHFSCSNADHLEDSCPLKLLCLGIQLQGIVFLNVNCLQYE